MAPFPLAKWMSGLLPGVGIYLELFQAYLIDQAYPVVADFTLADYPGYAPILFGSPIGATSAPDGSQYYDFPIATYQVGRGNRPGNIILGFFFQVFKDMDNAFVIHWQVFPEPVDMMEFGKRFSLNVSLYATSYKVPGAL